MIENSDADQIERLNSRIIELLRERDALVEALKFARARIDYLGAAHTNSKHFHTNFDVVLPKIDAVLAMLKDRA